MPNINTDNSEFSKCKEFFCEHFRLVKYNIHVHKKTDYDSYKGIKLREVTEKFQVETMRFVNVYTCEVCEFKSCGLNEHQKHFKENHENVQYEQACLFNTCEYTSLFPEELIKHLSENHEKSITSILKKLTQRD